MEARTSYVPLVNIVSQVPRDVIGSNRGFLHELPTQSAVLSSFAKWHAVAGGSGGLEGIHQPPRHLKDVLHGLTEHRFVRFGGAGETAQLAHELQ